MWFRKQNCRCDHAAVQAPPKEPCVAPSSPALALERSLTDPETRGEWKLEPGVPDLIGVTRHYRNDLRDISITSCFSRYSYGIYLSTPFTLTTQEEGVVRRALDAWSAHRQSIREQEALARLVSPASRIEAAPADETRSGSAEGESLTGEAGDAQTTPSENPS